MSGILASLAVAASWGVAQAPHALRWAELTSAALARLDRARTVVVAPAGIVEAHGALLPNGTEVAINERIAVELADSITARTGWIVVILPTIPLGAGAFDRRGRQVGVGGTLSVRAATVQAVFSDIADNLGQQGFRFVFVVSGHADANHDRALDLAGNHFTASFRGTTVHLLGRRGCHADDLGPPPIALFSAAAMSADSDSTSLAIRLLDGLDERTVLRIGDQRRADQARRAELDAEARREMGEGPRRRPDAAPSAARP